MGDVLKPETEQARHFLSQLWAGAEKGVFSLVSKSKRGLSPIFGDISSLMEAVNAFTKRAASEDLYYCLGLFNARPEKGRGTENDVIAVPGLWFDIDCMEGTHNASELPNRDEALALVRNLDMRPTFIIWSGGGFHVYWLFKKPLYFERPQDRQSVKELSSRFQNLIICRGREKGWKLDNTSDLCRILRLPGTFNHKKEPVPVEILEDSGLRYEREDFDNLLSEEPSHPQHIRSVSLNSKIDVDLLQIPIGLKKLIKEGMPRGQRSEAVMSVITSLLKARVSDKEIARIFSEHPQGIGAKYHEKSSGRDKWIQEEILRAREKFSNIGKAEDRFAAVKKQYPRTDFPWEVLPDQISISLKLLAKSCATSPTSLPGTAAAIFASLIGSTVSVSPKSSWKEPLIFWFVDIRPTGAGKTPPARMLCNVLYEAQQQAEKDYNAGKEQRDTQKSEECGNPPPQARGYFVTDLTMEGLRSDNTGHGGKVCILDEISAFIAGQNEYKQKGTDRESWLCIFDGRPARVVRARESFTISDCRISIFGGIQPDVWKKIFGQNDRLYLRDGTICRFLPTYEGDGFYPLTAETWTISDQNAWEGMLRNAMEWADRMYQAGNKLDLKLDEDALEAFINWRNNLHMAKDDFSESVRGFIPKLVGYVLKWSGALYLMDIFYQGKEPLSILSVDDVRKGIKVCEFYLGHIIYAMQAIEFQLPHVVDRTPQVVHLAKTLKALEGDVDNKLLAIGFIQEKYNENCSPDLKIKSPHLMGSILRKCCLTTTPERHKANERIGVYCLVWDSALISFLESCPISPTCPQATEYQEVEEMDKCMGQILQVL